jgi:hypothetical protein
MFPVTCTDCGSPKQDQNLPCLNPDCRSVRSTVHAAGRAQGFSSARGTATVIFASDTLLARSRELVDSGDFSISVIVAVMACEIGVEIAVSHLIISKGIEYLRDVLFQNYGLKSDPTRDTFNALTGEQVQQMPFWNNFIESVKLRNNTVHRWRDVTREEAERAHGAASELLAYLKKWSA